jgi:hypothetical protein
VFDSLGAKDAPACLLPIGRVLCVVGPINGNADDYLGPSFFFEFDPSPTAPKPFLDAGRPSISPGKVGSKPGDFGPAPFGSRLLLLPTGDVLFTNSNRMQLPDGSTDPTYSPAIALYTPEKPPSNLPFRPAITNCPAKLTKNQTYFLKGKFLNGVSQAVSYGDDATMATNYPLVRIVNKASKNIFYARTSNHSSMGVAVSDETFTVFTVNPATESGESQLFVVANGIQSDPFDVVVQ